MCPLKMIAGKTRPNWEMECIGDRCAIYNKMYETCSIALIPDSLLSIKSHLGYQQQKMDELIQLVKSCDL